MAHCLREEQESHAQLCGIHVWNAVWMCLKLSMHHGWLPLLLLYTVWKLQLQYQAWACWHSCSAVLLDWAAVGSVDLVKHWKPVGVCCREHHDHFLLGNSS